MKKNLFQIVVLSLLSFGLNAQDTGDIKSKRTIVVKANNLYQFSKNQLNNFYSLGGELGIYFNDEFYLGFAQYSSLSPADIWKNNPYNPEKMQVYEYSMQTGYKIALSPPLYLYVGIGAGHRAIHMEYRYNNGVDTDETMTREKSGVFFMTPDLKLGVRLHKYIGIEAGLNYRYNLGNKSKWGLSTEHLNGLGGQLSIIGNISL